MVPDERRLLRAIENIYEAATDPAGLDKLALAIARTFGSDSGFIAFNEAPQRAAASPPRIVGVPSATENFDAWARSSYADHYHDRNIWFARGIALGIPGVVTGDELVDKTAFLRSEWYEYCRKLDAYHVLGSLVPVGDGLIAQIGVHRPRGATAFGSEDKRAMLRLLPHVGRALHVQIRLGVSERDRAVTLEILDGLAVAVVIVDVSARVLFANKIAERVLRTGEAMTVIDGRLQLHASSQKAVLERLIYEAAQTSAGRGMAAGGIVATPRRSGTRLSLLVSPIRSIRMGLGHAVPAAAIVFSDTEGATVPREPVLAEIYGLTPAEARLLSALAAGQTLAQYSQQQGIHVGTARTHLKHVLEKTGYHRQTDLVRAVTLDPVIRFAEG